MKKLINNINNEDGAILFTVFMFILVLTAVATTMLNLTTFELDMARNFKCQEEAFFNGESGMRAMGKAISMMVDEGRIEDANSTGKMGGVELSQEIMDEEGIASSTDTSELNSLIEDGTLNDINEGDNEGIGGNETAITKKTTISGEVATTRTDGSIVEAGINADVNWYRTIAKPIPGGELEFAAGYEGTAAKSSKSLYFRIVSQGNGCADAAQYTLSGQYRHVNR